MNASTASLPDEPAFFSAQIAHARRFYLDLNPPDSQAMTVVSGGCEDCRPDYRVKRPGFRYFSIEFVAAGEGALILNRQSHRLAAGDIFAYGPGIPHEIQCDAKRPLVKYFVDFAGQGGRELLKSAGPKPGSLLQTSNPPDIRRLFEELISSGLRSTPFRQSICSAILQHLLLRIAETAVAPGTVGTAAFETYQRCHRFITAHYLKLSRLSEIADRCHLDSAYLCRLFGRFDHESPYQYLTRLKMIHAAEQLQVPGVLVKQVADQMGFSDAFQFSRSFKKVLGVSPRKFLAMRGAEG